MRGLSHMAVLCLCCLPGPILAQTISAADPQSIVSALQTLGYKATFERDSEGDPQIESMIDGTGYTIWFYGCDDTGQNCDSVNLQAGFDLESGSSLETMNAWNTTKLVGTASLDDEKDPWLGYFVVTETGVSPEVFERILLRWEKAVSEFKDHIKF